MVLKHKSFSSNVNAIERYTKTPIHQNQASAQPSSLREKCWKRVKNSLQNYCQTTSLHGCGYITRADIGRGERIFWTIVVLIAIVMCVVMVWISAIKDKETAVITVVESTHFSALRVPFPAVTICSLNRISKQKAYDLAKRMTKPINVTVDELAKLFTRAMDFSAEAQSQAGEYMKLGKILDANGLTGVLLMQRLVPSCRDMLVECSWKGSTLDCGRLFQRVNASEGICCSFNYHGLETNNFPERLAYSIPKTPYRTSACGYQSGLSVVLNPQIDDYFGTYLSSYGFRVLIHDAYDYPDANAETKVLPLNTENFIGILVQSSYATQAVRKLPPNVRNCRFHDERKLRVMQRFSYVNCLAECRALLTYRYCGCIPLRYLNNGSFPSCKLEKIFCVLKNINIFTGAVPGLNETIVRDYSSATKPCSCLPDCEKNFYPAEVASAEINRPNPKSMKSIYAKKNITNKVVAHIYYSDLVSTRYRKDIYQNWVQMLATFGGLLGLIMGFSFVTAFEFLYHILIHPIFEYLSGKFGRRENLTSYASDQLKSNFSKNQSLDRAKESNIHAK